MNTFQNQCCFFTGYGSEQLYDTENPATRMKYGFTTANSQEIYVIILHNEC